MYACDVFLLAEDVSRTRIGSEGINFFVIFKMLLKNFLLHAPITSAVTYYYTTCVSYKKTTKC